MEQRNDDEDDDEADGSCERQDTFRQDFEDLEHGVSLLVGGGVTIGSETAADFWRHYTRFPTREFLGFEKI